MRIPQRLQPPAPKPKTFRMIRFVPCLRCMGHGHFETDPPERVTAVAFSKLGGLSYLADLVRAKRLSYNQEASLEYQIRNSVLPDEIPGDIEQVVNECLAWEEKALELDKLVPEGETESGMLGSDLTDLVHDYLLRAYPHLRTQ